MYQKSSRMIRMSYSVSYSGAEYHTISASLQRSLQHIVLYMLVKVYKHETLRNGKSYLCVLFVLEYFQEKKK